MQIVSLKDKLDRARATMANVREKAKAGTNLVIYTLVAGGTAGAIGWYDQSKGVSKTGDQGIETAYAGPLPVALVVGTVGKVANLVMLGDSTGDLAGAVGQGGVDAFAYVTGRRMQLKHAAQSTNTGS